MNKYIIILIHIIINLANMGKSKIIQTLNPKKKFQDRKEILGEVTRSRNFKRLVATAKQLKNPLDIQERYSKYDSIRKYKTNIKDEYLKTFVTRNSAKRASEIPYKHKNPLLARVRKVVGESGDESNSRDMKMWNKQTLKIQNSMQKKALKNSGAKEALFLAFQNVDNSSMPESMPYQKLGNEILSYMQPDLQDAPDPEIAKFQNTRKRLKNVLKEGFEKAAELGPPNSDFGQLTKIHQRQIQNDILSYLEPSYGVGELMKAKLALRGGLQNIGYQGRKLELGDPNIAQQIASYGTNLKPREKASNNAFHDNVFGMMI